MNLFTLTTLAVTITERITKYSIVNGCFVKTPSGWIPQEEMSKRAYTNSITE